MTEVAVHQGERVKVLDIEREYVVDTPFRFQIGGSEKTCSFAGVPDLQERSSRACLPTVQSVTSHFL